MLPYVLRDGLRDLDGVGWGRGFVMSILSGPPQSLIAYSGFILVPLGHGTTIQPACAALSGLLLASLVLHEKTTFQRIIGGDHYRCRPLDVRRGVAGDDRRCRRRRRSLVCHRRIVLGDVRDAAPALECTGNARGQGGRRCFADRVRADLSFHLWHQRAGTARLVRKSSAGCRTGWACRLTADLSVRTCRHRAWRRTRRHFSGAGAGVRGRLSDSSRSA